MHAGTGLAVSWIAFVQQRHVSPLAAGQWQAFLAFYAGTRLCCKASTDLHAHPQQYFRRAGFWVTQNFLRPLRFSLALTLAPLFNRFISFLEARLGLRRQQAFGVYIFLLGAVTSVLTFGSIFVCCGPAAFVRS